MRRQFYTLRDFSGGVNDVKDPRDLKENELSKAENIMVDERGAIRTVGGETSQEVIGGQEATGSGGYGLAILESDYETEPVTVTCTNCLDFDANNEFLEKKLTITDIAGATSVITTGENHGFSEDDYVVISSTTNYNGFYQILTTPSATTFTIAHDDDGDEAAGFVRQRFNQYASAGDEILVTSDSAADNFGFYTITRISNALSRIYVDRNVTSAETDLTGTIEIIPKSDILVLLSDAENAAVDTYSKKNDKWTDDQIDLDSTGGNMPNNAKTSFYSIDGAIRACDGNFSNASIIKWFGQIKRTHFEGATAEDVYFGWYAKDNDLKAPTDGAVGDTYPEDNAGFDAYILTPANSDSTWEAATYQVASSFIYDGNQESKLFEFPSATHEFTVADGDSVTISVHAHTNATGYNPRISGGRLYARISGSDDPWVLLCDIDMRQGARATLDGSYSAWTDGTTPATDIDTGTITSLAMNLDTYESLNGFSHEETSISLGQNGEGWKTATVANRRAFVANIRRYDTATAQNKTFADRILYSEIGKFDTFPEHNYLDVVRGDAESYVKIIEYADRLLAFKQNSVQIINISSPSPSGWFLEDNKKYLGVYHPGAVTQTDYGIAWVNESGCYLYDGSKVINLSEPKIDSSTWSTFIGTTSSHISIIGFERFKKQLIIMKDCSANQGDSGDAWIYDFHTNSWVKGLGVFTNEKVYTNFVHDWNGDLVVAYDDDGSPAEMTFMKWSDTSASTENIEFKTRDIDFGNPGILKKIYKVYATYKSSGSQTTPFKYNTNGSTASPTNFTGNFSSASNWDILAATPSSAFTCQSLGLTLDTASSGTININDITIEYRPIHRRVS